MRPNSVTYFERLQFASLALGIANDYFSWDHIMATLNAAGFGVGAIVIVQLFGFAVVIALTLLISRRRSKIAMWVLIALFILGVPSTVRAVLNDVPIPAVVTGLQIIAQGLALILLFTPSGRRWMGRKAEPDAEAEIFS